MLIPRRSSEAHPESCATTAASDREAAKRWRSVGEALGKRWRTIRFFRSERKTWAKIVQHLLVGGDF